MENYKILIGGEWLSSASGETSQVLNPANGQVTATVPKCRTEEVNTAIGAAAAAFPGWACKSVAERSKLLLKLSRLLMANQESLAKPYDG